jgi:hypothetical protein
MLEQFLIVGETAETFLDLSDCQIQTASVQMSLGGTCALIGLLNGDEMEQKIIPFFKGIEFLPLKCGGLS